MKIQVKLLFAGDAICEEEGNGPQWRVNFTLTSQFGDLGKALQSDLNSCIMRIDWHASPDTYHFIPPSEVRSVFEGNGLQETSKNCFESSVEVNEERMGVLLVKLKEGITGIRDKIFAHLENQRSSDHERHLTLEG